MRQPYWRDDTTTLYTGNAREVLAELPDEHADCIVTSPPGWGHDDEAAPPDTVSVYVTALRRVFAEAHRVLAANGTLWLHLTDRYATDTTFPTTRSRRARSFPDRMSGSMPTGRDLATTGQPITSLLGIPWQVAFALGDDGWIIRNAVVLHRSTRWVDALPDDRFATTYDVLFLMAKQDAHYFAFIPPEATSTGLTVEDGTAPNAAASARHSGGSQGRRHRHAAAYPIYWIVGDVWLNSTSRQSTALPPEVPRCCIGTGCRPGGTVLDPFDVTGTTGIAARQLERGYTGITPDTESFERAKANLANKLRRREKDSPKTSAHELLETGRDPTAGEAR